MLVCYDRCVMFGNFQVIGSHVYQLTRTKYSWTARSYVIYTKYRQSAITYNRLSREFLCKKVKICKRLRSHFYQKIYYRKHEICNDKFVIAL